MFFQRKYGFLQVTKNTYPPGQISLNSERQFEFYFEENQ